MQVHAGGRGKAGGVKLVKSKKEVIEFSDRFFGKGFHTIQTGNDEFIVNKILVEKVSEINSETAKKMLDDGTISGGMIPKIKTCLDAVNNGVTAVGIIDGRKQHSILFEIFSDKGSGTLIRK